jgi:ribosome biogenesis GTPase
MAQGKPIMELLPGVIIRSQSGFYTVETGDGQVVCRLRGRLKLPSNWLVESPGDIIAVGDRVKISVQPDGSGMVEEIEPRVRELVRLAPPRW